MSIADVAVVGSGPAGSAAAIAVLRERPDLRVILIDKATFPRDKACGDGIGPEGVVTLDKLGVGAVLEGYPGIARVAVRAPNGLEAGGVAPRGGHVIPRSVFDSRLREMALTLGAKPIRRRISTLDQDRDGVTMDGGLRARWVVAADGANSAVRRLVGARAQPAAHMGLAMRAYADAGAHDHLLIRFVPEAWPAYAWAFPIGDGRVNVGFGPLDRRRVRDRNDLVAGIRRHLPEFDPDPATMRAHHLPLASRRPRPTAGRVLLAGDASSLIHPLSGEGITYALLSGMAAGRAVARHGNDAPKAYRTALRARLGRHLRHVTAAGYLFRWQTPVNLGVAVAARDPRALDVLCEFTIGTGLIEPRMVAQLTREALGRVRG